MAPTPEVGISDLVILILAAAASGDGYKLATVMTVMTVMLLWLRMTEQFGGFPTNETVKYSISILFARC